MTTKRYTLSKEERKNRSSFFVIHRIFSRKKFIFVPTK